MTRSVFSKEHSRNCHIAALQVFRQQASLLSLLSEVNSTCSLNLGEGSRGAAREKREGSGLDLFSLAHSPNPVLGRPTSPSADESAKSLSFPCFLALKLSSDLRQGCCMASSGAWLTLIHLGWLDVDSYDPRSFLPYSPYPGKRRESEHSMETKG